MKSDVSETKELAALLVTPMNSHRGFANQLRGFASEVSNTEEGVEENAREDGDLVDESDDPGWNGAAPQKHRPDALDPALFSQKDSTWAAKAMFVKRRSPAPAPDLIAMI